MINLIFSGVAIALLLAAGYWVRGRGGHRPLGTWAMAALLASFAFAFASYAPIVENTVDGVIPQVARLMSNSFTLCAATAVLAFMFQLNLEPEQARRQTRLRVILLVIAVAGMTALFTAEQMANRSATLYAFYVLIYISYLGYTAEDFLLQTWKQAKRSRRRSQRVGLRITAAGCVFALMYAAYKVVALVSIGLRLNLIPDGSRCSSPIAPFRCTFSVTAPALAVLLITVGLTLPAVLWPVSQFLRRRWETKSSAALAHLWEDLTAVAPEVVLDHSISRAGEQYDDSDYLLHRRVIETEDSVLALRPYRSLQVQERAQELVAAKGLHGTPEGAAIVEAAVITAAIRAKKSEHEPCEEQAPPAPEAPSREGSLPAETEWLLLIAAAYADNETVRVAAAEPTMTDAVSKS
ncbi:MAB_1171c family putative transporter [Streptomyces sp. 8N706]|uniref:MAB_1171c family putative transporter n=1 Tax=Streptomyces sp. 8N706 TaxID=3457416 RepID=UPI003FD26E2E